MDIITICILGTIALFTALFFVSKHRRKMNESIICNNNDVVPLMMQKATLTKVTRLKEVTVHDDLANEHLQKLIDAYKNKQVNIREYNYKLDKMVDRLDV